MIMAPFDFISPVSSSAFHEPGLPALTSCGSLGDHGGLFNQVNSRSATTAIMDIEEIFEPDGA
jgi:hypothetical protein